MDSNKGVSSHKLERQAYVERYLNANFLSMGLAKYESMDVRYWPAAKEKSFTIQSFKVPKSEVQIITSDPEKSLHDYFFIDDQNVRFHVHPDIRTNRIDHLGNTIAYLDLIDKCENLDTHEVSPTASLRTLMVINDPQYYVKCHFPRMLTPYYIKSFGPRTIHQSVQLTKYLKEYSHPKSAILPETIGITFPTVGTGESVKKGWGFTVRETLPYPPRNDWTDWDLYPLFSLYSGDINNPNEPVMITKMYDRYRQSGGTNSIVNYVIENIIEPLIETWVGCLNKTGVLLEKHSQNLLFEVNKHTLQIGRLVDRDFEIQVDTNRRKKLGLSNEHIHPECAVGEDPEHAKEVYSFVYDQAISFGITALARAIDTLYGNSEYVPSKEIYEHASEFFGKMMPDHADYFPKTVFEVSKELAGVNMHKMINTGRAPILRPVI